MRKKICFVSVLQGSLGFIHDAIRELANEYDIYIAAHINNPEKLKELPIKGYKHIDITRKISPWQDLVALCQLVKYLNAIKFDAVHSLMPKAGLLTALASYFVRIPIRLHTYTGQVWATRNGVMRTLLKNMDRVISTIDTHLLADSHSQRQFLISQSVISPNKSSVLASGSICGVNTERFCPSEDCRVAVRDELGVGNKIVFVFMGRLNRDKGIYELLAAFNKLASERKDVFLLLLGHDEENVSATFNKYDNLCSANFLYYGATKEPGKMLQVGDIFVLPTYREGFGSSVIEAQCLGLPVITSDAYGVVDASIEGVTGLRCKVGDVDSLYQAMSQLASDKEQREIMGQKGRERVLKEFSSDIVVDAWKHFYDNLLK